MARGNGGPEVERSIGEIVSEVSEKASLLVREEIELAKAEISEKVGRLGKGAVVAVVGATFLLFGLIYLLFGLAFLINDLLGHDGVWLGFMIVTAILFIIGAVAVMLAVRAFRSGSPPTPDMAIEEAKRAREQLEEARG